VRESPSRWVTVIDQRNETRCTNKKQLPDEHCSMSRRRGSSLGVGFWRGVSASQSPFPRPCRVVCICHRIRRRIEFAGSSQHPHPHPRSLSLSDPVMCTPKGRSLALGNGKRDPTSPNEVDNRLCSGSLNPLSTSVRRCGGRVPTSFDEPRAGLERLDASLTLLPHYLSPVDPDRPDNAHNSQPLAASGWQGGDKGSSLLRLGLDVEKKKK
jgi:hypothetical protein